MTQMKNYSIDVLSQSDITESFRMFCLHVWYSREIRLKDTSYNTHKLLIEVNNVRMHTVVQTRHVGAPILFLN